MNDPNEVRQCWRCGQAAAVCIRNWDHTTWGVSSGMATRDFACQSCGHRFTLVPKARLIGLGVVFALTAIACIPIPFVGGWLLYRIWPWWRCPVVTGAPYPVVRFRDLEPLRRCAKCQSPASCRHVTRRTTNGIPTGTEHEYGCARCGATFTMSSPGGIVFSLFGMVFLGLLGALTIMGGIGVVFLIGALFFGAMAAWDVYKFLRHPVVGSA